MIAGTQVTSENYNDISNFEGVSGRVSYDPSSKPYAQHATIIATTGSWRKGIWHLGKRA